MADVYLESPYRILHGATELLAFGDYTLGPILLDNARLVDPAELVRGANVRTFDRGNVRHVLRFTKVTILTSPATAAQELFSLVALLPVGHANVAIHTVSSGIIWTIAHAAIASVSGQLDEVTVTQAFEISGGALSV
jgi:hypothetical protein